MKKAIGIVILVILILSALGSCVDSGEDTTAESNNEVVVEEQEEVEAEEIEEEPSGCNYNLYENSYNTNYSDDLLDSTEVSWKCVGLVADGQSYLYNIVLHNCSSVRTYNFIVVGGEGQTFINDSSSELFPVGQLWLDPDEVNHVLIYADSPDYVPDINVAAETFD